jgi:hypothetical protein
MMAKQNREHTTDKKIRILASILACITRRLLRQPPCMTNTSTQTYLALLCVWLWLFFAAAASLALIGSGS